MRKWQPLHTSTARQRLFRLLHLTVYQPKVAFFYRFWIHHDETILTIIGVVLMVTASAAILWL